MSPLHAGWSAVGPPHKQRYLSFAPDQADASTTAAAVAGADGESAGEASSSGTCAAAGQQLLKIKSDLFETGAFARLLKQFTTIQLLGHSGGVRRFRPGEPGVVAFVAWNISEGNLWVSLQGIPLKLVNGIPQKTCLHEGVDCVVL